MKNKGFTAIELLAILAIVAIIFLVAIPYILNVVNDFKAQAYYHNEKLMKTKTEIYLGNYSSPLPVNNGDSLIVDLNDLKNSNLVPNIVDPQNSSTNCTGKVIVTKTATNVYRYDPYLKCGTNYETSGTGALNNLVSDISHVYNVGTNDYTITITMNSSSNTTNDANELITPTSTIGLYKKGLLDYSGWINGTTGTQASYSCNGSASECQRVLKTNPWGTNDLTWAVLTNDVTSDGDGGWTRNGIAIDRTKKYRLSLWIRREDTGTGSGTTYFGTTQTTGIFNLGTSTTNTNPYFKTATIATIPTMEDNWYLWVSYVWPTSYGGATDTTSGVYNLAGSKISNSTDFKFSDTATILTHRTYLYYSTLTTEKQWFYRPRIDLMDGTEPTLAELLAGAENPSINAYASLNTTGTITYNVAATGTYTFVLKRGDNSSYTFTYTVS